MTPTKNPRNRLFLMMVMEFFIWGAWLPLIFGYLPSLGFTPVQQAWILNAFPIAAIVGMFFSNQFADRHFAAERFLGFSHLVGGLALLGLGFTRAFWPFFAPDARALPALRPDHLDRQLDRLRPYEGLEEGVRLRPHGRDPGLDPGGLAVHVHSRGLGPGQGRRAPRIRRLARDGPRLGAHGPGVEAGDPLDVHRGGGRLTRPGRLQPAPPSHPSEEKGRGGFVRGTLRLARGGQAAQAPLRPGPVAHHLHRRVRP